MMVEPTATGSKSLDTSKSKAAGAGTRAKETVLPLSRIRTIMKCSPDVLGISPESLFVVCKATEMFIQYLSKTSCKIGNGSLLDYNCLSSAVNADKRLEFLYSILPKKITIKEYKEIIANNSDSENFDSDASEDESEDESVIELSSEDDDGKVKNKSKADTSLKK